MNEEHWLACTDPGTMVESLRVQGRASARKLRSYACACVRRVWHLLRDQRSRTAVEVAEHFVEGRASVDDVFAATVAAWDALDPNAPASMAAFVAACGGIIVPALAAWGAARAAAGAVATSWLARQAAWHDASVARDIGSAWAEGHPDQERNWQTFAAAGWANDEDAAQDRERVVQAALLRCVFGPLPFRQLKIEPAWRTRAVLALATAIDDERRFEELPILADALEEAGCIGADLLNHLRTPGVHVRGCFALDLLLGKG